MATTCHKSPPFRNLFRSVLLWMLRTCSCHPSQEERKAPNAQPNKTIPSESSSYLKTEALMTIMMPNITYHSECTARCSHTHRDQKHAVTQQARDLRRIAVTNHGVPSLLLFAWAAARQLCRPAACRGHVSQGKLQAHGLRLKVWVGERHALRDVNKSHEVSRFKPSATDDERHIEIPEPGPQQRCCNPTALLASLEGVSGSEGASPAFSSA